MGPSAQLMYVARQFPWLLHCQHRRYRRGSARIRSIVRRCFADLSTIMPVAIQAALKPMKERSEATILPMQRIFEGLQAEFVAFRAEKKRRHDDVGGCRN